MILPQQAYHLRDRVYSVSRSVSRPSSMVIQLWTCCWRSMTSNLTISRFWIVLDRCVPFTYLGKYWQLNERRKLGDFVTKTSKHCCHPKIHQDYASRLPKVYLYSRRITSAPCNIKCSGNFHVPWCSRLYCRNIRPMPAFASKLWNVRSDVVLYGYIIYAWIGIQDILLVISN